jgi:hypothetical protein
VAVMTRKIAAEPRCFNGIHCVAYPALGEPSKLSRSNPGTRCFACEERQATSELKTAAANKKALERKKAKERRWAKSNGLEKPVGREHTKTERVREIWERRKNSVRTCERGLRSALASGDERLVLKWPRLLKEAETRLAWAEEDLARAETRARSEHAC